MANGTNGNKILITVAAAAIVAMLGNAALVWRDQAVQATQLTIIERDIKEIKWVLDTILNRKHYDDTRSSGN